MKRSVALFIALTLALSIANAQFRRGGGGGRGGAAPPASETPEQAVERKVTRLTALLSLSTSQQSQATTIFTSQQTAISTLAAQKQTAETALEAAIEKNDAAGIQAQATALGNLESQDVSAMGNANAAFYAILNTSQQGAFNTLKLGLRK
jgi:Spy/CpxP family protein refolding chaperone